MQKSKIFILHKVVTNFWWFGHKTSFWGWKIFFGFCFTMVKLHFIMLVDIPGMFLIMDQVRIMEDKANGFLVGNTNLQLSPTKIMLSSLFKLDSKDYLLVRGCFKVKLRYSRLPLLRKFVYQGTTKARIWIPHKEIDGMIILAESET